MEPMDLDTDAPAHVHAQSPTSAGAQGTSSVAHMARICHRKEAMGTPSKSSNTLPLLSAGEKEHDLPTISVETVADLMQGRYADKVADFVILDCRYPYEFYGGHMKGAVNICDPFSMIAFLFSSLAPPDVLQALTAEAEAKIAMEDSGKVEVAEANRRSRSHTWVSNPELNAFSSAAGGSFQPVQSRSDCRGVLATSPGVGTSEAMESPFPMNYSAAVKPLPTRESSELTTLPDPSPVLSGIGFSCPDDARSAGSALPSCRSESVSLAMQDDMMEYVSLKASELRSSHSSFGFASALASAGDPSAEDADAATTRHARAGSGASISSGSAIHMRGLPQTRSSSAGSVSAGAASLVADAMLGNGLFTVPGAPTPGGNAPADETLRTMLRSSSSASTSSLRINLTGSRFTGEPRSVIGTPLPNILGLLLNTPAPLPSRSDSDADTRDPAFWVDRDATRDLLSPRANAPEGFTGAANLSDAARPRPVSLGSIPAVNVSRADSAAAVSALSTATTPTAAQAEEALMGTVRHSAFLLKPSGAFQRVGLPVGQGQRVPFEAAHTAFPIVAEETDMELMSSFRSSTSPSVSQQIAGPAAIPGVANGRRRAVRLEKGQNVYPLQAANGKPMVLLFHCEYSKVRGPKMYVLPRPVLR
jgi:hypothetical protein